MRPPWWPTWYSCCSSAWDNIILTTTVMCHRTLQGRFSYWDMKTVVTVIYFGIMILINYLTTPRIHTAEWQDDVYISNCRELWMKKDTVYSNLRCYPGMYLVGLGKTWINTKYLLSWLRFELLSLRHKADAAVLLPIFLIRYLIVVKEREPMKWA
jgi:hypothetical protein